MKKPDIWLTLIGLIITVIAILVLVYFNAIQPLVLFVLMFIILIFYLSKRDVLSSLFLEDRGGPPKVIKRYPNIHIWTTVLIGLYGLAVIQLSINIISRPLWMFIGFTLCALLIFLQIFFKIYKFPGGELSVIAQITILLICISLSSMVTFPHNGSDTWTHLKNAELTSEFHSIAGIGGAYKNYPLFPALIYISSFLTRIDLEISARVVVVSMFAIGLLFFFALAKDYYGSTQRGLIVILLLLGSKWFLYWNTFVVSMATAINFFLIFYVLLNERIFVRDNIYIKILLLLVAILMPFFHPVGALAIVIMIFIYWIIDNFLFPKEKKLRGSGFTILVLFVIIVTLTQWIYFGRTFEIAIKSLAEVLFQETMDSVKLGVSISDPITYTLDNLNFYALLCLALIEILRQIRIRNDRLSLYSGICGLFFIAFGYSTQFINIKAVLPYRWLLFGTIMLVIPASSIFISLFKIRSPTYRIIAVVGFTFLFFLGFANKDVNRDNPFYGIQSTERFEITSTEYSGLKFIENNYDRFLTPIAIDYRSWDYLKNHLSNLNYLHIWHEIQLKDNKLIFVVRNVYFDHRIIFMGDSIDKINLSMYYLNQFYDNGNIKWLDWTPNPDQ